MTYSEDLRVWALFKYDLFLEENKGTGIFEKDAIELDPGEAGHRSSGAIAEARCQ